MAFMASGIIMNIKEILVTDRDSYVKSLKKNLGKVVICRDTWIDDLLVCGIPRTNNSSSCGVSIESIWVINFAIRDQNQRYRYYNEYYIGLEKFFDRLRANHPDHLEWLLFHPEYLA